MTTKFDELVAKLKEIFQIDKPELDFGIYKIMNAKASMIQDFLNKDLKAKVQAALADKATAGKKAIEEKIAKIEATLAPLGVSPSSSPEWVAAKAELDKLATNDDSESLVYAHLLTFFSRYYDDGDFVSKRRYKEGQYAIPYSGEEVKLHWANADQYYTKSGENFTNYDFSIGGKRVHFKLVQAAVAKDNVKDNECVRCFVLWDPASAPQEGEDGYDENLPKKVLEVKDGELYIYFQYKKIKKPTKDDKAKAREEGRTLKNPNQKDFSEAAITTITQTLQAEGLVAEFPILTEVPTESNRHRTVLEREFTRYTAKNTSDYFVHKNLKKFLTQELDNYVKVEMLNLDDISNVTSFDAIASSLRLIQTFRLVAKELIGFMAQLEDFQKKLWLKKKFVVQCDYCITMDRVPEELHAEVLANQKQLDAWKALVTDGDPKTQDKTAVDARMVDTKFFDEAFKSRLLRAIPDLDEQCGGVIIHSENFQALNFLRARYMGVIDNIYIDPPYNSKTSEILYKNTYKHSAWLSLLFDRVLLASRYGRIPIIVAIDENEQEVLGQVLSTIYPKNDKTCVSVIHNKKGIQGDFFSFCHEFAYFSIPKEWESFHGKKIPKENWEYNNLRKWGSESERNTAKNCFYPIFVKGDEIVGFGDVCADDEHPVRANISAEDGVIAVYPVDESHIERKWRYARDSVESILYLLKVVKTRSGEVQIHKAVDEEPVKTVWSDNRYIAGDYGTKWLSDMGIKVADNLYPKSLETVKDSIYTISETDALTMDFFGGSGTTGHAVISLNRDQIEADGYASGKRRYILVEMGDHFETVLKPRLIKAVYSPSWNDEKPVSADRGISHCFKYMTLESYEDTLNNLKLEKPGEFGLLKNEYMLNYMLEIESRKSLLNLDKFAHPFDYTLELAVDSSGATKPQKVDMVETFNYLIGLRVGLIDRHIDKGYVLVQGDLPNGEEALVLWRDLGKVDNDELKKILDKQAIHPREKGFALYVNGDHSLPNTVKEEGEEKTIKVRSIEAEFTRLMFEEE